MRIRYPELISGSFVRANIYLCSCFDECAMRQLINLIDLDKLIDNCHRHYVDTQLDNNKLDKI